MSARLPQLQVELRGVRGRLEEWARRLGALREGTAKDTAQGTVQGTVQGTTKGGREGAGHAEATSALAEGPRVPPAPLFHGLGPGGTALEDVELHFEVLDTEDPGSGGR
ncbi:MAG TPA: hypothetical protein VGK52_03540 [Polyangia bacterium]|jgi:hypothetical protein